MVEQRLCFLQIERVEALGEPAVDRGEKLASLIPLALIAPEAGEASGGARYSAASLQHMLAQWG